MSKLTPELGTKHWSRLYGPSLGSAQIKTHLHDFIVEEELGFEPSGAGEHIFLWVEKSNLNTAYVAEELAKFSALPLRAITYAGRKDKYALTRQWFGVHIANNKEPDWSNFHLDGARIVKLTRNDRKLRVGVLKANRFELTLRNVSLNKGLTEQDLLERLNRIKLEGAPNYYGSQRFGEMRVSVTNDNGQQTEQQMRLGGNLSLAQKMIAGEAIRNRNKRSLAISAIRSWLFNEVIHQRIQQQQFNLVQLGDAMQLSGSNSFFIFNDPKELENIQQRLSCNDINITAPLVGDGQLHTSNEAKTLETNVLKEHTQLAQALNKLGLKQERRAIRVMPTEFEWHFSNTELTLSFTLPSGCFATSIVRELFDV
ncbi:tRNA pseudouridine(13) synthase TruD [Glaciecola sp. MH2013]|uniref:tRNA pseudouridine(13) synthase TruD n=1 Tax=Glaciecola sp. MH2013 TaxID=2785524 RepID=UPI00189F5F0C|nr:tRNA pseudouridine(13) synthase TruD [Glaciecola sp. MH2013]MBF7071850.1 tRNA pseudouridine(13) synthase TruD [Glaciecola sp. MH2013]